jgi:hypothetical protein
MVMVEKYHNGINNGMNRETKPEMEIVTMITQTLIQIVIMIQIFNLEKDNLMKDMVIFMQNNKRNNNRLKPRNNNNKNQ